MKNCIIIFWAPLGEGGQKRIAEIVYEYSRFSEDDIGIIFLPPFFEHEANYVGTIGRVEDGIKFLHDLLNLEIVTLTLEQAERKFILKILENISKYTSKMITLSEKDLPEEQHYFNDIFSYYTDLKLIYFTAKRGVPLKSFSGTLLRNVEAYPKSLVNYVKDVIKEKKLKPSRVKVIVLWSKSDYHVRPDFEESANKLVLMLQDFFADVQLLSSEQSIQKKILTTFSRPTCIIIACSEKDFRALEEQSVLGRDKVIVIKATLPPSRIE